MILATTMPAASPSIWGEITPSEIVLLVAGAILTLAIIGFFVWVMVRASRDSATATPASDEPQHGGPSDMAGKSKD